MNYIRILLLQFLSAIGCLTVTAQNTYQWNTSNSTWSYAAIGKSNQFPIQVPADMRRDVWFNQISSLQSNDGTFTYDEYHVSQTGLNTFAEFNNNCPYPSELYLKLHNDVLYYKLPYGFDYTSYQLKDDTIVNFNASIGDQWSFHDPYAPDFYFPYDNYKCGITTVLDTGTNTLNGENLKWVLLGYNNTDINGNFLGAYHTDTIYEKIGAKHNLVAAEFYYGFDHNADGGTQLACYSDNNYHLLYNENICEEYTGMHKDVKPSINVYPNPVENYITLAGLDFSFQNKFIYSISDLSGKITLNGELNDSQSIDVSTLSNGNYLLTVSDSRNRFLNYIVIAR